MIAVTNNAIQRHAGCCMESLNVRAKETSFLEITTKDFKPLLNYQRIRSLHTQRIFKEQLNHFYTFIRQTQTISSFCHLEQMGNVSLF